MFFFTDCIDTGYQSGSKDYVRQDTDSCKAFKDRNNDQQAQYRDEQEKEFTFKTGMDYGVTKSCNHFTFNYQDIKKPEKFPIHSGLARDSG